MNYQRILSGEYTEEVPCRVEEVAKSEVAGVLGTDSGLLQLERIPRVLHPDAFSPDKPGFYVESEITPQAGQVYLLRPAAAATGTPGRLVLKYGYFTHSELLKRAGIQAEEYQSRYNKVGSIIHLNLNEETLKHKEIISKVLYDKISDCTTVIRKVANISGVFRNIEIEHLQGKRQYRTVQKENGLRFSVDYDRVYWNSKLQIERQRLVQRIRPGETVGDLFCGVGPFSILALARGAVVYANDLNPASIKNFQESVVLNRKALGVDTPSTVWDDGLEERVFLYNLDAAEFLFQATRDYNQGTEPIKLFNHYILNLPELTLQYLAPFVALELSAAIQPGQSWVHAYFFARSGECPVGCVEAIMKRTISSTSRLVRKVSPSKEMWLVSFALVGHQQAS